MRGIKIVPDMEAWSAELERAADEQSRQLYEQLWGAAEPESPPLIIVGTPKDEANVLERLWMDSITG